MITETRIKTEVLADDCVRLSCFLPFPQARVYEAWTKPEQIVKWFGPYPKSSCRAIQFDVRPGGVFELVLLTHEGEHQVKGEFEIVEPVSRLGFTWGCGNDRQPSHVIVELFPEGSGTRLELTDTRLVSKEQAESHTEGWTGRLNSLSQFFEGAQ